MSLKYEPASEPLHIYKPESLKQIKYVMTSLRSDMGFGKLGGNVNTGAQVPSISQSPGGNPRTSLSG